MIISFEYITTLQEKEACKLNKFIWSTVYQAQKQVPPKLTPRTPMQRIFTSAIRCCARGTMRNISAAIFTRKSTSPEASFWKEKTSRTFLITMRLSMTIICAIAACSAIWIFTKRWISGKTSLFYVVYRDQSVPLRDLRQPDGLHIRKRLPRRLYPGKRIQRLYRRVRGGFPDRDRDSSREQRPYPDPLHLHRKRL